MKTYFNTGNLILLFGVLLINSTSAQSRKEQKKQLRIQQYNEMVKLVESKNFIFIADRALPHGMQPVDLVANHNFTRITDSIANAEMPFFGRGYTAPLDPMEIGIKYNNVMYDLKIDKNEKKLSIQFRFNVKTNEDVYRVFLDIGYSGYTSMIVNSNNKSSIQYQGEVSEIVKEAESE